MDKTVFITGGTRNSGLAIARRFAAEGYQVAISGRSAAGVAKAAEELEQEFGVKVRGWALDLKDPADIRRVFRGIAETFGGLDVFVPVAASLGIGQEMLSTGEEDFDDVFDTNVKGTYFCCQEAVRLMRERGGGAIVMIGSVHYRGAVWGRSLYAASKGALATLVRSLAVELAEYHIRVNQVVPGAVRTDRWDGLNEAEIARRRRNWPSGVESTGEDIARAVYFLASDQAGTITGSDLTVDSGILACLLNYDGGRHS